VNTKIFNKYMPKQVIVLFGQPGAGKGTQAELLAERTKYSHIESSKLLEDSFNNVDPEKSFEIEGKVYKMGDEKNLWQSGALCSYPFITYLINERVKDIASQGKGIIFSGSPRSVYEAEHEVPPLIELYGVENIKFFLLNISAETTIFRNSHRKICELMRHSILFNKETENLTNCPLDGSTLVKRKNLDDVETIKKRLEVFKENTFPVVEVVKKQGVKVIEINAEQTVSQVFNDIVSHL